MAGDVEQHAAPDHLADRVLDAALVGAAAVDQAGVVAVPHLLAEEDVGQRVPLGGALGRQMERVVGVAQARRLVVLAGDRVGAGREHGVDRVPAAAPQARLRPLLVEREAEREDLAAPHQARRGDDRLGRDEVERADLVVRPPPAPVLEPLRLLEHVRSGVRPGHRLPSPASDARAPRLLALRRGPSRATCRHLFLLAPMGCAILHRPIAEPLGA